MIQEAYLTIADVGRMLGIAKSSVQRRIADGSLPKPIKIGHLSRFKRSEIEQAIHALEAQRYN